MLTVAAMSRRWVVFLAILYCLVEVSAAEVRIDGGRHELSAGEDATQRVIAPAPATLAATAATTLRGRVRLERIGQGFLVASVVPQSLRRLTRDDWREAGTVSGTRHDAGIDFTASAMGTAEERARFRVSGNDSDWDNVSIQWDGLLVIDRAGTDLATNSDDGSRVWIDLDGDDVVDPGEWGSNGWGSGQGATLGVVHRNLPVGAHHLRVQWEDGGGPNCCRLLWNHPDRGTPADPGWRVVPVEAFAPAADLTVTGPITVACEFTGSGRLRLAGGARLAVVPDEVAVEVEDHASLGVDLDFAARTLRIGSQGALALAGHRLTCGRLSGGGTIDLAGGTLTLAGGSHDIAVEGPGTLMVADGVTRLLRLDPRVEVRGRDFVVRCVDSCRARVRLGAPLGTVVPVADEAPGGRSLLVSLEVPADAPADLGVVGWRCARDGTWFQRVYPRRLTPGNHELRFDLGSADALAGEGHAGRWTAAAAGTSARTGVVLFSTAGSSGTVLMSARVVPVPAVAATQRCLLDLELDGWDGEAARAATGRRWEVRARPEPMPANPYDPDQFHLDLEVTMPDGSSRTVAGFAQEPVRRIDEGDRERFVPDGAPRFVVRFRAKQPGRHRLRLIATWAAAAPVAVALGDLIAEGPPWDDIVRPDPADPRFFSAGGRFVWPIGLNLNSTYDVRSLGALGTVLTPDRGSFTRDAYLERMIAGGGTGCETWLSAWNLGLEWIPEWSGYPGAGRYHPGHAWALDRFLDRAEDAGVRVNLNIFNHGMARQGGGPEGEWPFHPWNAVNGGPLVRPAELFTDPRAFAAQRRLFRYLVARYGDSPALLGWKLWAEVNLAEAPNDAVVAWHERAAQLLAELDGSGRAATSHWCGDWTGADRAICAQPGMGYLTIDAYHDVHTAICDLLATSTRDPILGEGLVGFGKPIWVSEYGGSPGACSRQRLIAEHAVGPWVGLVSGHAASPMLWWFEWVDQENRYAVYGAVARFLAGEDLRGSEASCVALAASAGGQQLWCRAWWRPGRILGYVLDRGWSMSGGDGRPFAAGELVVSEAVSAGTMTCEWWDCDLGAIVSSSRVDHPGGRLALVMPEFRRHLAFKLMRLRP